MSRMVNEAGASLSTPGEQSPRTVLNKGAIAIVIITAVAAIGLRSASMLDLPWHYFATQDIYLLTLTAAALPLLARAPFRRQPLAGIDGKTAISAILLASLIAYLGSYLVIERYGVSRDEQLADFATSYLSQGHLARSIPVPWRPLAPAIMPIWAGSRIAQGYWISAYLPINSVLRALAGRLGDTWLAGPMLLALGAGSLWSAARRIWPDRPEGATVALVLALTSSQLLVNAMTPYAMTAHFALNALWLALFVRGDARGHAGAVLVGLAATGIHQLQFHLLFLSGFIAWMLVTRRYRLAALYGAAALSYVACWTVAYPHLIDAMLGPLPMAPANPTLGRLAGLIGRLHELEPVTSLARFVAWQNVLLVPLALLGAQRWRGRDGDAGIELAFALSCLAGLATMVFQGHGYGYRYLHGVIPCFCLLGAKGWLELRTADGERAPAALLWTSALVAIFGMLPIAAGCSHRFLHPYALAYRTVSTAPANVVFVDAQAGAFLQDIVRLNDNARSPLLLDLGFVDAAQITALCRSSRTMLFGRAQAAAVGVPAGTSPGSPADVGAANLRLLRRLGCDRPVPIDA